MMSGVGTLTTCIAGSAPKTFLIQKPWRKFNLSVSLSPTGPRDYKQFTRLQLHSATSGSVVVTDVKDGKDAKCDPKCKTLFDDESWTRAAADDVGLTKMLDSATGLIARQALTGLSRHVSRWRSLARAGGPVGVKNVAANGIMVHIAATRYFAGWLHVWLCGRVHAFIVLI
jgi:hypothetical protein